MNQEDNMSVNFVNKVDLTRKILKTSVQYNQGIHPRIFCRRWFGLEATNEYGRPRFTEAQILARCKFFVDER